MGTNLPYVRDCDMDVRCRQAVPDIVAEDIVTVDRMLEAIYQVSCVVWIALQRLYLGKDDNDIVITN